MNNSQVEVNPFDAIAPYQGVSPSYKFYSTREIVDNLGKLGWVTAQVTKTKTRLIERRPFSKHMVRMRNPKFNSLQVGSSIPELVLINAHDATSSLKMLAGIFRLICSNGLIRQTQDMGSDFIPHTKLTMSDVIQRANNFGDYIEDTFKVIDSWSKYYITPEQERRFLQAAFRIRYPEKDEVSDVDLEAINRYRRQEDIGNTLWLTLNRVQENVLQGGFAIAQSNRRSRRVKSVDRNYQINTKLWQLAEDIYKDN